MSLKLERKGEKKKQKLLWQWGENRKHYLDNLVWYFAPVHDFNVGISIHITKMKSIDQIMNFMIDNKNKIVVKPFFFFKDICENMYYAN